MSSLYSGMSVGSITPAAINCFSSNFSGDVSRLVPRTLAASPRSSNDGMCVASNPVGAPNFGFSGLRPGWLIALAPVRTPAGGAPDAALSSPVRWSTSLRLSPMRCPWMFNTFTLTLSFTCYKLRRRRRTHMACTEVSLRSTKKKVKRFRLCRPVDASKANKKASTHAASSNTNANTNAP
jgi:hypothetical protein